MDLPVMLIIGVFALLLLLIITAIVVAVYSGLLHDIRVGTGKPPVANMTVAYKFARGPYKDCSSLFTETCSLAPKLRCIGVYYDDPDKVAAEKLRYAVGSILAEGDEVADASIVKLYTDKGFKLIDLPTVTTVVRTTFPFTTAFSVPIAVYRVYPALYRYLKEKKLLELAHPWCEIYHDCVIDYMAPLDHQNDFYVPEAAAAEQEDKSAGDVVEKSM